MRTHQPVKVGGFVFFIRDFELIFIDSPHPPVKVGGVFIIKRQPGTSELCSPEHPRSARTKDNTNTPEKHRKYPIKTQKILL